MAMRLPGGKLAVVDGLISLLRCLEAAVDVYRISAEGTAEHALARQEMAEIRRRIAALQIEPEALTSAFAASQALVLPPPPPAAVGMRRVPRIATTIIRR